MFDQPKRILMAAADAAPTGSNPAAAPASTSADAGDAPQAQGDSAPLTAKDLKSLIGEIRTELKAEMKAERDSYFAEARRVFTEKRNPKPASEPPVAPEPSAPSAAEEHRMSRGLDRALVKLKLDISDRQYERAQKALLAEKPEDVSAWAKDYFDGYGSAPVAPAATTTAPTASPKPQNEHPVSDRGAPPATKVPLEEQDVWSLSDADRDALVKLKGPAWFRERLRQSGRGRKPIFD